MAIEYSGTQTEIDVDGEFIPDDSIAGKAIEFKLVLTVDIFNWTRNSNVVGFECQNPTTTHRTMAVSDPRKSLKRSHVRHVVRQAFDACNYFVPISKRRKVIARAWNHVRVFKTQSHASGLIKLDCAFSIRHDRIYHHISADYPRMVPAADLSLQTLEEYKQVDGDAGGCGVCLEEIAGGGCLRMPCSHVFHGDCIKEWLRTSHYCPLCRYQMPSVD